MSKLERLESFIRTTDEFGNWNAYVGKDRTKLTRKKVLEACSFPRSTLYQTPEIVERLALLESDLLRRKVLSAGKRDIEMSTESEVEAALDGLGMRVTSLRTAIGDLHKTLSVEFDKDFEIHHASVSPTEKDVQLPLGSPKKERQKTGKVSVEPMLILIRGVPGSGKSTLARKYKDHVHLEADMFFKKGEVYVCDRKKLPEAHQWCLDATNEALAQGKKVVVSNVFAQASEIQPYVDFGYPWKLVEAAGRWMSTHDVPEETIERLRSTWLSRAQIINEINVHSSVSFTSRE